MLGHRGCRLGITFPEITEMQARAIFEAAAEVQKSGIKVRSGNHDSARRFRNANSSLQVEIVHRVAANMCRREKKVKFNYLVGTMIEVPRGALTADEIARDAEFFSFGTNDLTQTALGMSRDDSGQFPAALHRARNRRFEIHLPRSIKTASAELMRNRASSKAARRDRKSSSAFAANTAAIPTA